MNDTTEKCRPWNHNKRSHETHIIGCASVNKCRKKKIPFWQLQCADSLEDLFRQYVAHLQKLLGQSIGCYSHFKITKNICSKFTLFVYFHAGCVDASICNIHNWSNSIKIVSSTCHKDWTQEFMDQTWYVDMALIVFPDGLWAHISSLVEKVLSSLWINTIPLVQVLYRNTWRKERITLCFFMTSCFNWDTTSLFSLNNNLCHWYSQTIDIQSRGELYQQLSWQDGVQIDSCTTEWSNSYKFFSLVTHPHQLKCIKRKKKKCVIFTNTQANISVCLWLICSCLKVLLISSNCDFRVW